MKILEFLKGKRSYITAFLFAVFNFGIAVGFWAFDNQIWILVNTILGALGFGFMRAGISNEAKKIK